MRDSQGVRHEVGGGAHGSGRELSSSGKRWGRASIAAAAALVLALTACTPVTSDAAGPTEATEPELSTSVPAPGSTPTSAPASIPSETTSGPAAAFEDGTWLVGTDIAPGVYETIDEPSSCYWERLSGLGGTFDEILANNNAETHEIVAIVDGDVAFSSSRCGRWAPLTPREPLLTEIPPGRWAVGVHIAPGRYRSTAGDSCYWERLSGFSGSFEDIVANDNVSGQAIVDIEPGDVGFSSSRCGTWEPVG